MHFLLAAVLLSSWVQVRSDAFVVKSPIGVEQAATVLKELETFYQIVGGEMFRGVRTPDLPLEVLVLQREEIAGLGAAYIGDPDDLNGFYQKGIDRDFIVLSADLTGKISTEVVYHELTHYLASRAMLRPPTWLNEGLGEYFASATISGNRLEVGRVLEDKVRLLRAGAMLPLEELFAVGPDSSYYNERDKANVFYSQAWALVHFLFHGQYAEPFHEYLGALRRREADLIEFLPVSAGHFERDFVGYLRRTVQAQSPLQMEAQVELVDAASRTIDRAEIDASLAEMLLSSGRTDEALPYLEAASHYEPIQTRIEYFRGVLAWVAGEEAAREHFVDSLIDEEFGSRAAFHLVQMRELGIPEVRTTLEQAAAAGRSGAAHILGPFRNLPGGDEADRRARRGRGRPAHPTGAAQSPAHGGRRAGGRAGLPGVRVGEPPAYRVSFAHDGRNWTGGSGRSHALLPRRSERRFRPRRRDP